MVCKRMDELEDEDESSNSNSKCSLSLGSDSEAGDLEESSNDYNRKALAHNCSGAGHGIRGGHG